MGVVGETEHFVLLRGGWRAKKTHKCPFCGSTARISSVSAHENHTSVEWRCEVCGLIDHWVYPM